MKAMILELSELDHYNLLQENCKCQLCYRTRKALKFDIFLHALSKLLNMMNILTVIGLPCCLFYKIFSMYLQIMLFGRKYRLTFLLVRLLPSKTSTLELTYTAK